MNEGHKHTGATPSRTLRPNDGRPSDTSPALTWATAAIGGAALVVVLTAGVLFLGDPRAKEETGVEEEVQKKSEPEDLAPLAPSDPLDITARLLDAQERAKIWNESAMLASIEVLIEEGRPKSAMEFVFGEPMGSAVPGAPLSPKRHRISYEGEKVEVKTYDEPKTSTALPVPNCPLEAAHRQLAQSGSLSGGPVAVLYLHAQKEGRPMWLMTTGAGKNYSINAQTCALLAR